MVTYCSEPGGGCSKCSCVVMELLPAIETQPYYEGRRSEDATSNRRAMTEEVEKWILVELGNCNKTILDSQLMFNLAGVPLQPGAQVVVTRNGAQEIAIYLAKSNDYDLLDRIMKETGGVEQAAEATSPPPPLGDEEVGDFSGSASSWVPSEDDVPDSSDGEIEEVELRLQKKGRWSARNTEMRPPKQIQTQVVEKKKTSKPKIFPDEETPVHNRSSKKVLTPSNKVNAIIPHSMKKDKAKTNLPAKKRKFGPAQKENIAPLALSKKKVIPEEESLKMKVSLDVYDVIAMRDIFKELLTMFRKKKKPRKRGHKKISKRIPEEIPVILEEDDFNRSDDNVLITNKYDNIQNKSNVENVEPKPIPKPTVVKSNYIRKEDIQGEWVPIGSGKTVILREEYNKINWRTYTMATRDLLLAVFSRRTLATHSLTGKKSPAFQNKPAKMCLDPKKVSDIIIEVMDRFNVKESFIRSVITTKCADESKMFRMRTERKTKAIAKKPVKKCKTKPKCVPAPVKEPTKEATTENNKQATALDLVVHQASKVSTKNDTK